MRVLFVGDIVGEPGRKAVAQLVPRLRRSEQIDCVIANGENAAGGSGITGRTAGEILSAGVDVITLGDHAWDQKEIMAYIPGEPRLLRPLNYPHGAAGGGSGLFQFPSQAPIVVINLQGRAFMGDLDNPFLCAEAEVARARAETPIIVVDMHAEATSEKMALARMLDGQVSAVLGTHTHVQTADEQILPGGTAFLTDAGFTGPFDSVIGIQKDTIIERFLTQIPNRFDVAKNDVRLQGVVLDIDAQSGRANAIERISVKLNQ